jgi:glycosyltransferase involved in cell wall biosynthesis
MKIALLHFSGPPTIGGVEQTMYYHAKVLADFGYQPTFIVGKGEAFSSWSQLILIPRLFSRHPEVLAAKQELDQGLIGESYLSLCDSLMNELSEKLDSFQALIVHNALTLHKNLALTKALWTLHHKGKLPPMIGWHHDFAWERPDYINELHEGSPWDLLKQPWPGVVNVVVSAAQQEALAQLYQLDPSEINVISPGVDPAITGRWTELTQQLVSELGLLDAEVLFLLPARITRRKNIEFAIEIVAEINHQTKKDVRLIISGPPGPHNPTNIAYLNSLQDLVVKLGIQDSVHFLYQFGPSPPVLIDDETMANLFDLCDALLFPSRDEGFGIPVLEAGLKRMPVFCSDLQPFRESGEDQIYRFKLTDPPQRIAAKIADTLLEDRAYILRNRIRRKYTWRNIIQKKFIPVIERLIDV